MISEEQWFVTTDETRILMAKLDIVWERLREVQERFEAVETRICEQLK